MDTKNSPIQLVIIGDIALAGFPFEITTIAGKRLRDSLFEVLKQRGVSQVILCPYANGYSGYITTYEENIKHNVTRVGIPYLENGV